MYAELKWALKALVAVEVLRPSWILLHAATQREPMAGCRRDSSESSPVGNIRPPAVPSLNEALAQTTRQRKSKYVG